ncbi:MAG: 2-oxoglutarate ferredoxin oxidoreductase subunit gamma [Candidatus Aerophobetes bacterium ADurb.Bin490]|nr:MAG: 2-oxoglutarate ferredoxin oxidoreductase subunit gamma [Candidatus Aerophobetes bacterium ADurb.Bin490]
MTEKIMIAGSGGQGVLTLGLFLARVAAMEKKNATWLPAYGAEKRGGFSHCSVIISDEEIFSPMVENPDTLIVFDQRAYDSYKSRAKENTLVIENSTLVKDDAASPGKKIKLPALEMANKLDLAKVMNVVVAGAYVAAKKVINAENALETIKASLGKKESGVAKKNIDAFKAGMEYAGKK